VNFFKNSHSKIDSERGTGDFDSSLFRSTKKLQLRFFDPPLDQLVEGSDTRELLDPPLSLAVLNSRSEMRRISFVVVEVFAQERSRSGPPQIRDGSRLESSQLRVRLPVVSAPEFFGWRRSAPGVSR